MLRRKEKKTRKRVLVLANDPLGGKDLLFRFLCSSALMRGFGVYGYLGFSLCWAFWVFEEVDEKGIEVLREEVMVCDCGE